MGFRFLTIDKTSQLPERSEGWRRANALRLPKNAGVYCFKNGREFLYIGKAANIRERVENHFQQPSYRDGLFLDKVKRIGYIKTNSEIEALIFEANLIKKYQPKYNVVWRDDKNYFFIGTTKEDYPRVFITHQPVDAISSDRAYLRQNYVGPFVDGKALKQTLKILRKVFPYRSCYKIPNRPCLWYHLNRCLAPCLLKFSKTPSLRSSGILEKMEAKIKRESQRNARNLIRIITEGKNPVLKELKREMKLAAKNQDFETAAKIRDQIEALKKVLFHAKIFDWIEPVTSRIRRSPNWCVWRGIEKSLREILKTKNKISRFEAYDISNIQGQEATGSMVTFVNGLPNKNFYRHFKIKISGKPNDIAMIKEVLNRRFKHPEWGFPDLILIDGGRAQLNAALTCLRFYLKHVEVMALAKKHNELFIEGQKNPIRLNSLPDSLKFAILRLRDEAHRFAISYHRKLRKRALLEK